MKIAITITKTLLLAGLAFTSVSIANARDWYASVEDDLFSDTGKKASLSSKSEFKPLVFDCDSSGTQMALLFKDTRRSDEDPYFSATAPLILKVDDAEQIRFNAEFNRRNEYYMQLKVTDTDSSTDLLNALKQIRTANSRILVGVIFPNGQKSSEAIGVSGSTAATTAFMEACGLTMP